MREELWTHIELDNNLASCCSGEVLSGHVYLRIGLKPHVEASALTLSFIGLE